MSRSISHLKPWYWVSSLTKVAAAAKAQVITRTATGGTVDATVAGETVTGISIVAATTAANVKASLLTFLGIDTGDIDVTGSAGGPFTVTGNIGDISIEDASATGGTVVVSSITPAVTGNGYAPTVAELAAATNITGSMRSFTGWASGVGRVDSSDLNSLHPKSEPGLFEASTPSIVIYHNTDPGSDDRVVEALLVDGETGFIVRSLDGIPAANSEVQVWPVEVMAAVASGEGDATSAASQTVTVNFSTPDSPDLHAIVAA